MRNLKLVLVTLLATFSLLAFSQDSTSTKVDKQVQKKLKQMSKGFSETYDFSATFLLADTLRDSTDIVEDQFRSGTVTLDFDRPRKTFTLISGTTYYEFLVTHLDYRKKEGQLLLRMTNSNGDLIHYVFDGEIVILINETSRVAISYFNIK